MSESAGGIAGLAPCDVVVEAAAESEVLKRELFEQVSNVVSEDCVLASNTSSISITRIATAVERPERVIGASVPLPALAPPGPPLRRTRVLGADTHSRAHAWATNGAWHMAPDSDARTIGMHFMNPVPRMRLVEVIRGAATDDATFAATVALAEGMGKTVVTSRDFPGFIVNRVLMPMINEAFCALHEGVATAHDIDAGMTLGTNQPMGPLTLADFIGLDTCLAIMRVLHDGLGDSKYRPCPMLVQYVDAGWHGRKVGRGVYTYDEPNGKAMN